METSQENQYEDLTFSQLKKINEDVIDKIFINCEFNNCDFTSSSLDGTIFDNSNLSKANFSNAKDYDINPLNNIVKKAVFTMPEAMLLLRHFNIIIK